MKIILGLGLDAMQPKRTGSRLGCKELGPIGMLAVLETQFGIAPVTATATTRIIQYLGCLQAANNVDRFYHHSFDVDQFNVAKTLLYWRDSWYEAGWDGQFTTARGAVSSRLADLAAVEAFAQTQVSAGFGQRLQRVLALLERQRTQIEQIILLDSLADFTPLWQQVLAHFPLVDATEVVPSAIADNDLRRVQQTLQQLASNNLNLQADGTLAKVRLQGDGSFQLLKAHSKAISAQLLAQWLQQQQGVLQVDSVALLASADGYVLDDALASADLPRLGFEHNSPWRPVLQVLPLALALLWEPLNPETLLQFLLHPVGVLPRRIRYPLAEVVASAPGIGGAQWQQKLSDLLAKESSREGYTDASFKQLVQELDYWFASARYKPTEGIPLAVALQRVLKVSNWLAQQLAFITDVDKRKLFAVAYQQADELKTALTDLLQHGALQILPAQLHLLLQQLLGTGAGIADQTAECTLAQTPWLLGATTPDSFYAAVHTVVWWDLQQNQTLSTLPWSQQEIRQLRTQGVQLPHVQQQLQQQALQWLKPIFAARERLLIVCHDDVQAPHPLWDQLTSCLQGWQEIQVEASVLTQSSLSSLNALSTVEAHVLPLATVKRWWKLEDPSYLAERQQESYSSLEHFFYSPYQWVLRYKAQLAAGTLQTLTDGNTLKGLLVHCLYQCFFEQPGALQMLPDDVEAWVEQKMEQLLEQQGAVLLQPGRMIEKAQFVTTAKRSLQELLAQLKAAQVLEVKMEVSLAAPFFGGNLVGYADMLVRNAQQQEAVIDIKWGGMQYRRVSLKNNTHLQLVTYAYLQHQQSSKQSWPSLAYFIIDAGQLLAQDNRYFPHAQTIMPEPIENQAEIWQRMAATWKWRREQLDQGLIEVTVHGTEPDSDSKPGADALAIAAHHDHFNDYRVLTGFGVE